MRKFTSKLHVNTSMRYFLLSFAVLFCLEIYSQNNIELIVVNKVEKKIVKKSKITLKDSISVVKFLSKIQQKAISKGYIGASIDSLRFEGRKAYVHIYTGKMFKDIDLELNDNELKFLKKKIHVNERIIARTPISPAEYNRFLNQVKNTYLNNGYPFVQVKVDDFNSDSTRFYGELKISRGKYYQINKIHVKGDSSISEKFIQDLVGIYIQDEYNEKKIREIKSSIDQCQFIDEIKPLEVLFKEDGAELFLYLKSTPVSAANGIIGFQPDAQSGKLRFTGDIQLKLLNVLKRGELMDLQWKSIQVQTQSLDMQVNFPFLFNTPFGIDGKLNIYKRDTSFLEIQARIGVEYILRNGSNLKAFYKYRRSSLLSGGLNNPSFDNLRNVISNGYGVEYTFNKLDYFPNPRKGFETVSSVEIANRKTTLNDTIAANRSLVYRFESTGAYYIPVYKRNVIKLGYNLSSYQADSVYQNELYRYGGLKVQRGFNEQSLFATTKLTLSFEYRFLLDRNSFVFAFFDQSWYENTATDYLNDQPFGFGAGFSFGTKFGIFSISYALGSEQGNPILFSNSKVHFGYVILF